MNLILQLVCLFTNLLMVFCTCDYAEFGSDHTMCIYSGKACEITKSGFTAAEKAEMVRLHNIKRQELANGKTSHPKAANMMEMKWNNELEMIAQRWTDQCQSGHDRNSRSKQFAVVGQNAAGDETVEEAFNAWFDEEREFGFLDAEIPMFQLLTNIGHYSQQIWADSRAIGCGSAIIKDGKFGTNSIVCNYGPAGNFLGGPVYEIGEPCSKCKDGCSKTYPGLCRNTDPDDIPHNDKVAVGKPKHSGDSPNNGGKPYGNIGKAGAWFGAKSVNGSMLFRCLFFPLVLMLI